MSETICTIKNVDKHFGHFQALNHVSLTIGKGDIYGLIGENGAGKTTLMRLMTGLSPLQTGDIELLGEHVGHASRSLSRIGAVIESPALFEKLTVAQNLKVCAIQHGQGSQQEIDETIAFVGLTAKRNTKAKNLSLGQRQRLGLGLAILPHPDFLILDEPINGLDPTGIMEFRALLQRLNQEQHVTILISSHILTELYQVSTRFGILHHGTLIKELTKAELDEANQAGLLITVDDTAKTARLLDQAHITPFQVQDRTHILIMQKDADAGLINHTLVSGGIVVEDFSHRASSLEDYYTHLLQEAEGAVK
ncbi:ABC transporter ATP-binding protein [Lacticaseibacillus mingshuiensis]|uniref:ABC transporter ATP-binding protein n=1 Tax=Lacticaseibacillus mingshuiensis TaxID=2799574 RepID=A0ABW4CIV7_9LACO|nr:ABC transporter ATP-binding protein [Lacticaseibacillus mingshuiensis]